MSARYAKRGFTLGTEWVPIVAPMICDYCAFRNVGAGDILVRTDLDIAESEDIIPASGQDGVTVLYQMDASAVTRFHTGEIVQYAKSADGQPQRLMTTWVR